MRGHKIITLKIVLNSIKNLKIYLTTQIFLTTRRSLFPKGNITLTMVYKDATNSGNCLIIFYWLIKCDFLEMSGKWLPF